MVLYVCVREHAIVELRDEVATLLTNSISVIMQNVFASMHLLQFLSKPPSFFFILREPLHPPPPPPARRLSWRPATL